MSADIHGEILPFKIIWLNGMPRSGTNWLSQIFDSNENVNFKLAPLFSYAFKNAAHKDSPREVWVRLFREVYESDDPFINQKVKRESGNFPVFKNKKQFPEFLVIKDTRNHQLIPSLLGLFDELKIIHIVRNPCGAIHSWLSAPREFPADADPMTEWRTGQCRKQGEAEGEYWGFDDWKLVTTNYTRLEKQYPDKVKMISYEDLVDDPMTVTKSMFDFIGLDFTEETRNFLVASQATHSDHEYAVFKSKKVKDKWKQQLNSEIINEIRKDLEGSDLEKYLHK